MLWPSTDESSSFCRVWLSLSACWRTTSDNTNPKNYLKVVIWLFTPTILTLISVLFFFCGSSRWLPEVLNASIVCYYQPHRPVSWTKGAHTRTITADLLLDAAEHGLSFGWEFDQLAASKHVSRHPCTYMSWHCLKVSLTARFEACPKQWVYTACDSFFAMRTATPALAPNHGTPTIVALTTDLGKGNAKMQ